MPEAPDPKGVARLFRNGASFVRMTVSACVSTSASSEPARKRKLDIEQALQWAFREEAPKMRPDQALRGPVLPAVHPMWRAGAFGGRIDNWANHDPGFPLAMGEPHPDAVLIINAVKGCDVEKLDLWGFLIPYRIGESFDQVGIMEKARRETVAVLIACATSRTRPDTNDRVAVEPVRSITGQTTVWVREAREYEDAQGQPIFVTHDLPTKPIRKGVYPAGAFTKIRFCPSAATVALDRAKYAAWWAALEHITELLQVMGLQTIELSGPTAPRMPWTEEGEPEPAPIEIVPSLLPHRGVILKDRRVAGRRQRPRRHSEVRHVYHRGDPEPAETA